MRSAALGLGACGAAAAWLLWQQLAAEIAPPPGGASLSVRLGLACAFLLPPAGLLWAMLLVRMAAEFANRPGLAAASRPVVVDSAIHLLVFAVALLALAAELDAVRMPAALALAAVFTVGRVAFWAGALVLSVGGAFGTAVTLAATAGALGWAAAVSFGQ